MLVVLVVSAAGGWFAWWQRLCYQGFSDPSRWIWVIALAGPGRDLC